MQDTTLVTSPPPPTDTLVTVDSTVAAAAVALDRALPLDVVAFLILCGAVGFGLVVGWVTYRTIRRSQSTGLTDIAAVIGAVGGAAVTALFPAGTAVFGAYGIGLAIGFFGYFLTYLSIYGKEVVAADPTEHNLLGGNTPGKGTPGAGRTTPRTDIPPPPSGA